MYSSIILKTVILYFFIVVSYRIMGKKEVTQLSIIDLIVSILIAELAAMSIEETSRSIFISIVPIVVLVVLEIILSFIQLKSSKFRKIIDGSPKLIINKGKLMFNQMKNLRYSLDDLITQLREQGIKNIEDVNYAILENSGKLSVFSDNDIYPLPIILDGKIDFDTLYNIKKDPDWLYSILSKKRIELENVFYAFYTKQKTYIIKKDEV